MTITTAATGGAAVTPGNGETREKSHLPTTSDAGSLAGPAVPAPRRRRLRTFAFDPMSTRLSGRYLTISVPYETILRKGPQGKLLRVVDYDPVHKTWYALVDLDDAFILAQDGLQPSEGDPRSHQQIVYAVASSVIERFERYLGRRFRWRGQSKLSLVPHAFEGRNAYFDPKRKAVLFGYYRADANDPGANLPGQVIFTCLSSDIIAHEVTHAIVHRLRPYFAEATNPDVFAWHEAFADLIALFQHFAYREVVLEAIASTSGSLEKGRALFDLASEFGQSTGRGAALRSAINPDVPAGQLRTPDHFNNATEPHERGAIFVGAVFDAFLDRYQASVADLLRIATNGTGVLPEGALHPDLVARVTTEAIRTADRYLAMVVRAFDYLPPVDVTFGDVIRAIATADHALYPTDTLHLRGNLIEALRRRGIYPERVDSLTDSSLCWPGGNGLNLRDGKPEVPLETLVMEASMNLDTDANYGVVEPKAVYRQLTKWAHNHAVRIGLEPNHTIAVASLHVAYRQAEDAQPRPEIVVQFTQRRKDLEEIEQPYLPDEARTPLRAGTTLIARVNGEVQHIISKPLPLKNPGTDEDSRYVNMFGEDRLEKIRNYFGEVSEADPLTAWTDEPAAHRLTFANLHSNC
ncbi:hypothetical protein [Mycobacterium sp. 3519A]|uniref:hypothetical protein n=1 Tax=Mycobacterium sp. 3519A TaxID=2057184 RepID=UPI00115A1F17|nr:hypothetical protein [Mycobacterium sp. 3519A]